MNWMTGIATYVVLWWIVLFCTLPVGIRPVQDTIEGHDPGAPANPRLGLKALVATGVAAVLFGLLYLATRSGWIDFRTM